MRILDSNLNGLVEVLFQLLDDESERIEIILERLNELRSAVITRDEQALKELLEKILSEQDDYSVIESRRNSIRSELAQGIGCSVEQMNLSKLYKVLPENLSQQVSQKQEKLRELTNKLKTEHKSTKILLNECARINNMLLRGIFCRGRSNLTYNSSGGKSWDAQRGMVNIKL